MFPVGKTVEGSGLAIMNAPCLILISEIAPARVQGPLLSCFTLFTVVGQIIGISAAFAQIAILAPSSYRIVLAVQWGLAAVIIHVAILVPESPIYLIKRNKFSAAAKAYKRLFPQAEIEKGVTRLQATVEHEMEVQAGEESSSIMQCFKGTDFRRTRIIIIAFILQQLVGITMVANATYFLELAGISPNWVLTLTIVELALGIPTIMASWFTMTIFGRRPIFLLGIALSALLWLAMGIAGCFANSIAMWFIGIDLIIIFVVYSLSLGAAYPVIAAESSSLHLRAASQSVGFFFQFLFGLAFSFTIPYMFDVDAGNLGGKVVFIFAAPSVFALVVVWIEVPEMNRSFAELDDMFQQKIPTRQFKNYVDRGVVPTIAKVDEANR